MSRFMRAGVTPCKFLTALVAPAAPTTAEMTAGVNLTAQCATISGFTYANQPISVPDFSSAFENKIPGKDAAEDSSMEFYEDNVSNPIKTALAKGAVGWVVFNPYLLITEVFPVIVASNARMYSADNVAAMYKVMFTVTGAPVSGAIV